MTARNSDALSAIVARQRGRARLRTATIALGAVSLVAAGAVAYHLPSTSITAASKVLPAAGTGTAATVHTTSGGSGTTTVTTSGGGTASAPSASTGGAHAASGGS